MCGILVTSGMEGPFSHRLLDGLRKRGPDQTGFWSNQGVNVAHVRLAIIGLDERGVEPMESQRFVLAYNGEIYNFNDISKELNAAGVALDGANDAEVLLHAWQHWGAAVLSRMTGIWAFVLYDKLEHKLTLVRDQFGVKPLYYWQLGNKICVSSLLRTILDVVKEPVDLDYRAMSEYVRYQFTFGDKTFIKQIKKVVPGHVVEIDLKTGAVSSRCYEDIFAPSREARSGYSQEWVDETRTLIERCVLDSTISDTSFTTFCSGGIDSSLITRLAVPEIAYHCNYSDPECNETRYAKRVVEDTPIRLFVVNAQESFNLVERLTDIIDDFDELTIGSVILPLDDLLAQVRRRYKVVLTGTGGDEMFGGYVRYQLVLGECHQDSYRQLFLRTQKMSSAAARFEVNHHKGENDFYRFYEPQAEETFREAFEECSRDSTELEAMIRFDRKYFLAGLLNIDDKMCGRHSLESRPSFLHQHLVRHVLRLDPTSHIRAAELKPVLRDIAQPILPESVVGRTDKMGFTTPVGTFVNFNANHIREQITGSRFRDLYNVRKVNFTATTKFSREVFGLLMMDLWLNRYASGGRRNEG